MTKPVITVVGSFAVGMTLRTQRMPVFGETRWSVQILTWDRAAKAPIRLSA